MIEQYHTLLFDADRTLLDTEASERAAIRRLMEKIGIPFSEDMPAVYYHINEELWQQIETGHLERSFVQVERWRRFLKHYEIDADPALLNQRYLPIFSSHQFLTPYAQEVCQTLSQKKPLHIITNGTALVQKKRFSHSPISPYLSQIFISEEVGVPKPKKEFFDHVLSRLPHVDRKKILIIGDSLTSDILGGNNAGIDTCWYNPKGLENRTQAVYQYEIQSLQELLP